MIYIFSEKYDSYIYDSRIYQLITINMTTVVHLQIKGGVKVQDCDIYIGRVCNMGGWRLLKSKWHNPYSVKQYGDQAIPLFEKYIRESPLINDIEELRGKILGCWCKPKPCHGDILIKILNERGMQQYNSGQVAPMMQPYTPNVMPLQTHLIMKPPQIPSIIRPPTMMPPQISLILGPSMTMSPQMPVQMPLIIKPPTPNMMPLQIPLIMKPPTPKIIQPIIPNIFGTNH